MSLSPLFGNRGSFGARCVMVFLAFFFEAVAGLRDFLVALDFNLGFFGFFALSFVVMTHLSEILIWRCITINGHVRPKHFADLSYFILTSPEAMVHRMTALVFPDSSFN